MLGMSASSKLLAKTLDVNSQKYLAEVENALVKQGLDMETGITVFRKFVGQLKSEMHISKSQNAKKAATIKRYRQILNEGLSGRNHDTLNYTQTFPTALALEHHTMAENRYSPQPRSPSAKKTDLAQDDSYAINNFGKRLSPIQ